MRTLGSVSVVFIVVMMSYLYNPLLPPIKYIIVIIKLIKSMEALPVKDGAFDHLNCEVL